MIDLVATFVELLKDQDDIANVVSTRVYDTDLPRGANTTPDAVMAIAVRQAPNSQYFEESPVADVAFELLCFGPTPAKAREIERAIYDAIRGWGNVLSESVRWMGLRIDQGGQAKLDEQTTWEFDLIQVRCYVVLT